MFILRGAKKQIWDWCWDRKIVLCTHIVFILPSIHFIAHYVNTGASTREYYHYFIWLKYIYIIWRKQLPETWETSILINTKFLKRRKQKKQFCNRMDHKRMLLWCFCVFPLLSSMRGGKKNCRGQVPKPWLIGFLFWRLP